MRLAGAGPLADGDEVRLVDLSVPLGPSPSELLPVEIERIDHRTGGAHLAALLGIEREALPGGLGWASERISAVSHVGTHMDAPFHCAPRSAGRPARTIDEVPLGWFWGPAACLRVEGADGERAVTLDELHALERAGGGPLAGGTIVLFRTGAERWHGSPSYLSRGRPLAAEVVAELTARGVRVLGTDAWSIDPSPETMRETVQRRGAGAAWEAHRVAAGAEFCVLERLCNLAKLPERGFQLACFPIKVHRGSAGWVRPVALVPGGGDATHRVA
jgi:kynurenine formamidase